MSDRKSFRTTLWVIAGIYLLLAIIFRWTNHGLDSIVSSDGKGYFAYLPAVFTWADLDYAYFFNGAAGLPSEYSSNFCFLIEGSYVNKYPCGVSVLLIPFYLVAALFTLLFGFDNTGYSPLFQLSVSLGAISYSLLGLWALAKLLGHYAITNRVVLFSLLAIGLGTNLLVYTIHEPSMSHAYSFAMVACFLYGFREWLFADNTKGLYYAAISLGLIVLIRPVNAIVVFSVLILLKDADDYKLFFRRITESWPKIGIAAVVCLSVIFIQPLLWYLQNGHWYNWTYLGESFNWANPEIFKVLFSYRKGWFVYTPFMLLLVPALVYLVVKRKFSLFFGALSFWLALIYIVSSWWCWYYGGSFGQRTFIDFYPVALVTAAPFLASLDRIRSVQFYSTVVLLCILLNVIQSYQYKFNILHWDAMDREKYWKVFLRTGGDYEWLVFKNLNLEPPKGMKGTLINSYGLDFEGCHDRWIPCHFDYSPDALSGNNLCKLTPERPYSPTLKVSGEILKEVRTIDFYFWAKRNLSPGELEAVYSYDDSGGKTLVRIGNSDHQAIKQSGSWIQYNFRINPDSTILKSDGISNVYLYNNTNEELVVDDLVVFYIK